MPHGLTGRVFGALMTWLNAPAVRYAADAIELSPGQTAVELGFGTGRLVRALAAKGVRVAGVDPSVLMVETARRANLAAVEDGRADLRLGAADRLPWPENSFAAAFALHSFQFWPDPRSALLEISRVLEPGGRLVLVLRRSGAAWLPNPLSRMADEEIQLQSLLTELGWVDVCVARPRRLHAAVSAAKPA